MYSKVVLAIPLILWVGVLFNEPSLEAADAVVGKDIGTLQKLYFQIKVVDDQTGRGVPLVELKTTNNTSYFTDSNGIIAFYEPGLMDREVFFHISSHGYEYPKDGFGFRGKRIKIEHGGLATIKVKRVNVAERLYRITGQGIYRDSVICGNTVSLANPVVNGLVMGQDSVQTCWYKDKLHWFWGDTARPSYPLGHFAMAGAVSLLPWQGGLDPSDGVDLNYFKDETGFSRKMAPMSKPGMVWLDGLFTVEDSSEQQHMLAVYARMKSLSEPSERGLMHYNDETNQFIPIIRSEPEFLLYSTAGHPLGIENGEDRYYYFATAFPLSVRMRVRATWESATDPNEYEVFTALHGNNSGKGTESKFRWISSGDLLKVWKSKKSDLIKALQKEKESNSFIYDIETGSAVNPHGGSVYWNEYRHKWVMITVQSGGNSSYLGEVWYGESDTPLGPWCYARKVVTHNNYSFYNPKHHPYLDQADGRLIYFEGTYSHTFSGTDGNATPRYDYNQIMYRLDLSNKRLCLPEAVYEVKSDNTKPHYLVGNEVRSKGEDAEIVGIPFYAISPDRANNGLIPIYGTIIKGMEIQTGDGSRENSASPIFYGLPMSNPKHDNDAFVVGLFEYTNKKNGTKRYSVKDMEETDWQKSKKPLCLVWKNLAGTSLTEWESKAWRPWSRELTN